MKNNDSLISIIAIATAMLTLSAATTATAHEKNETDDDYTGPSSNGLTLGFEGGVAYRSGSPSFDAGAAWGANASYRTSDTLSVGAYYLAYTLPVSCFPDNAQTAMFHSLGLRARFVLPIPDSIIHPFATLGFGWVATMYPQETIYKETVERRNVELVKRDGNFLEAPLGIGVGFDLTDRLELGAQISVRPAFGFRGDVYEGDQAVDASRVGLTGSLGLDFKL